MSVCKKCGAINEEGYAYCLKCGEPIQNDEPQNFFTMANDNIPQQNAPQFQPGADPMFYMQQQKFQSDVSDARLLGILALVLSFFVPIGAFICGGISLSKLKQIPFIPHLEQDKKNARTMSIIGIVIASLYVLAIIIYIIAVLAAFADFNSIY